MTNTARIITISLLTFLSVACATDEDEPQPMDCKEVVASTKASLDIWEVRIPGDVIGPGDTYRCGGPDENEEYAITWSQTPRVRISDGAPGFIGRPRLANWPTGTCAFFPADAVRYVGDARTGMCEGEGDKPKMRKELEAEKDEGAKLRMFIQEANLYLDTMKNEKIAERYEELRKASSDMINKITAGQTMSFAACPWCGHSWPKADDLTRERANAIALEHDNECPKHPLRIERDELRTTLLNVCSLQLRRHDEMRFVWAVRETANRIGQPFSMERVEELLDEEADDA